MDELISSSTTSSIQNYITSESTYSGVESISIDEYKLGENAAIGFSAAGVGIMISLGIAALIRFFYQV